jgi:glycosyltransferase involved in cell wall biosynthesis
VGALTFSIVLCTRNRAGLLNQALDSIAAIDFPPGEFELVLVDNASTDDTPDVARAMAERAPFSVRCLRETRIGLSAARNTAIREASGEYLFFTDDDQLVDPSVLREHLRVARRWNARVVQGGIELRFTSKRPEWLRGDLATVLGKTRDVPEGPADIDLYGGNMLFRRDVFGEMAAFREDLGKGAAGYSEDIEITARLRERGERIVYAPTARIYHVIGPDRSTPAFFRRNSFDKGVSDGLLPTTMLPLRLARTLFGIVRHGAVALATLPLPDRHATILAQSRAANDLGRLLGYARALRR